MAVKGRGMSPDIHNRFPANECVKVDLGLIWLSVREAMTEPALCHPADHITQIFTSNSLLDCLRRIQICNNQKDPTQATVSSADKKQRKDTEKHKRVWMNRLHGTKGSQKTRLNKICILWIFSVIHCCASACFENRTRSVFIFLPPLPDVFRWTKKKLFNIKKWSLEKHRTPDQRADQRVLKGDLQLMLAQRGKLFICTKQPPLWRPFAKH